MTLYDDFWAAELCVIPLKDGRPVVKWSQFFDRLPTPEEVSQWRGREYGLVCGSTSGVIAVDIDDDDLAESIYALAGNSPVRKRGSKGFTAFYRYNGELSHLWKKDGVVICELLSNKRLTTIPPSPHRKTGEAYQWLDLPLAGTELPFLSDSFIAGMDALYPRPVYALKSPEYVRDDIDLSQACEMLDYISPSCSRDEWVQVGMALRDEFGDAACNLWHEWSSKSEKYNLRDAQAAWRSFCHDGVTIGSLVHMAKAGGWVKEYHYSEPEGGFGVDISYIFKKAPETKVLEVHGLVGEVARWITETAIRPQPVLSLGAALVFVGMMKGQRVRGVTNLRTNILSLLLAPTSAGKDHPQRCIDDLAQACGLAGHVMAEPTSGTAMLTGIAKGDCISMLLIDEIGRFFGNLSLKSSAGFQREIMDNVVKLFSSAGRTYRGRQYANERENPQVVLHQPHFCFLGATVPERLAASVSSAEMIDGFLNRWLVFASDVRPDKQRGIKYSPPPVHLVERIMAWLDSNQRQRDQYGNPSPQEVRFTPEAWDVFTRFDELSIKQLDLQPYPINQLYARSAEHAEKVALCLADDGVIGVRDIELAIDIVNQSNEHITRFAESVVDNQHEADVKFVLDAIKREGKAGIPKNKLTRTTQRLDNRRRTDILNQLIDGEQIRVEKDGKMLRFYA